MTGDDILACWPEGFLTEEEGRAIMGAFEFVASETATLATEEEMALTKVRAAVYAGGQ